MNSGPAICLGPPVLAGAARIDRFTRAGVWGTQSLPAIFYRHADARGDVLALADCGAGAAHDERELSYAEVDRAVRHLAARFEDCGLKPGDIVAVQLPPVVEAPVAMLACLGLGFIVCTLPMSWRRMEIEAALIQIGARAIVTWSDGAGCDRAMTACAAAFGASSIRYVFAFGACDVDGVTPLRLDTGEEAPRVPRAEFPLPVDANALALISWDMTAPEAPRALARSHNECVGAGMATVLAAALGDGATILSPYPLCGLAGIATGFAPWLMTGGLLCLHRPFDPDRWRRQVTVYEPDLVPLPAALAVALALALSDAAGPPVLALVHEAGVAPPPPPAPRDGARARTIEVLCLGDTALIARPSGGAGGSPGSAVPLGTIRAAGENGLELLEVRCGAAAAGDAAGPRALMVAGAAVPSAILTPASRNAGLRPAGNAEGFVATGHFVRPAAEDGSVCVVAGNRETVRVGAAAVALGELDGLYASCTGVADAAAIARADPVMGARLVAAVVAEPGARPDIADIHRQLRVLGAAEFKLPERLLQIDFVPRDEAGQVARDDIAAQL